MFGSTRVGAAAAKADLSALRELHNTLPIDVEAITRVRDLLGRHAPDTPLARIADAGGDAASVLLNDAANRAPLLRWRSGVISNLVPGAMEPWTNAIRALDDLPPLALDDAARVGQATGLLDDATKFLGIADAAISARIVEVAKLVR